MKLAVIGTGFVGVVTSAVMAKLGHTVWGLDIDEDKIKSLNKSKAPFYEPGLDELLQAGKVDKRLHFTTDYKEAISNAEIVIIAVGTPSAPDGTADLTYVMSACESLAPFLQDGAIVAIKSTVPPSTTTKAAAVIKKKAKHAYYMASLPEFLREGVAVDDTLHPDRVVIGASEDIVIEKLLMLHEKLGGERVVVAPESAQMAKYTANAYLALRITFINQIANLCEKNGAKISEVIKAIGFDKRIGTHYWYPGLGYGGSCFPKDVKELAAYAKSIGEGTGLLPKIDSLNEERIEKKMRGFEKEVGGFQSKKVTVLGLSFKPNTNDMREAPSLKVIPYLAKAGAMVTGYDPQAMVQASKLLTKIRMVDDAYDACDGAEVIILLVEWSELKKLDLKRLAKIASSDCYFIDTRNQYDPEAVNKSGLKYLGIGNG